MSVPREPQDTTAPLLLPHHLETLTAGSGLSPDVVDERGYRSIEDAKELLRLGFGRTQLRVPGLLLPIWTTDGKNGAYVYRPDSPRRDPKRGRELKYEMPAGGAVRLDVPPRCQAALGNPAIPLWFTEGQKKGDALASRGLTAVALLGVWNFKGRNPSGGTTLLADFDCIALKDREVYIVFDSDVMTKQGVRDALDRLKEHLERRGARATPVYLPSGPNAEKVGVDDYLLTHSPAELVALAAVPQPAPRPAADRVELLAEAPPTLSRPLALIDGQAYAAAWLWMKRTRTESVDRGGKIIRHDPPQVVKSRELFVVRGDGAVYGPGEAHSVEDLGLEVRLPDVPRDTKLWSAKGVDAYRSRLRPDAAALFRRVAATYDHFIDFGRSLAGQTEMCELSACGSIATWFTEASTVIGYFWPNGERGSGKTKWGTIWANTSYLGEVVLTSGSFAALRDLADYGAALLFDDAEILSDPKKSDPNKRELFLAGNRRGALIALKEPRADGRWETRWVNAYCPRAFTAISAPDPVVASRSIIVPLTRSGDHKRANLDPGDPKRWPHNRADLQDELWATALMLLPEAERVWAEFEDEDELSGRELEPWRAVLMIARVFERQGVSGLEERIRQVMRAYQMEKADLVDSDWTLSVVRALVERAFGADVMDVADVADVMGERVTFTASDIAHLIRGEASDPDTEWATPRRVGRIMARLRVGVAEKASTRKRDRQRTASKGDILAIAQTYGVAPVLKEDDPPVAKRPKRPERPNVQLEAEAERGELVV